MCQLSVVPCLADTTPPSIKCSDIDAELSESHLIIEAVFAEDASGTATVVCHADNTDNTDNTGSLPIGAKSFQCTATDAEGLTATCTVNVAVIGVLSHLRVSSSVPWCHCLISLGCLDVSTACARFDFERPNFQPCPLEDLTCSRLHQR